MKICYTVCSLNRLGQILVLSKTFLKHNQDYKFFACLVDEIDDRFDPQLYSFIEFIPFSSLPLTNKQELSDKYDIFELSCASKAFFGNYLIQNFNPEILIYLDTDICVYDNFLPVEQQLLEYSILITAHFSMPVPDDGKYPLERDVLNSGLYNGGFFAIKNNDEARSFFKWWQERLFTQGFNNVCEGMMVDQLWLNLVPIYFANSKVFNHPGCNLAYWNLPERKLELWNGKYFVNGQPLIFFHFSGYRIDHPKRLSGHQNRINESDNSFVNQIIEEYYYLLIQNNFAEYLSFENYYGKKKGKKKISLLKRGLIKVFASFGYSLEKIRTVK
jgi:hypothetical protein